MKTHRSNALIPILAAALLALPVAAWAQHEEKDTEISAVVTDEPASQSPWYQKFEFMAFVDAYFQVNYLFPKPNTNNNGVRAFAQENGFALQWAGIDLSYPAEPVGGTIALRFGPTASRFSFGEDELGFGLEFLKEAFVTLAPLEWLTIDFGKFGTIYGAEVPESWLNYNYTRGVVNWATQPFYHTGLRVGTDLTHGFTATALVVNGWDNTIDNNTMISFGAQLGWSNDMFGVVAGWMGGPEQTDTRDVVDPTDPAQTITVGVDGANDRWRHFIDVVVTFTPTDDLGFIFDGDVGIEKINIGPGNDQTVVWYGLSLATQLRVHRMWALALRGEFMGDPDGYRIGALRGLSDLKVVTGTFTIDFRPWDVLVIRLDNRLDWADNAIFQKGVEADLDFEKWQFTTTLGVVFHVDV